MIAMEVSSRKLSPQQNGHTCLTKSLPLYCEVLASCPVQLETDSALLQKAIQSSGEMDLAPGGKVLRDMGVFGSRD